MSVGRKASLILSKRLCWALFFLPIVIAGIIAARSLVILPADPKTALLFGLSFQRLALLAILLLPCLAGLWISLRSAIRPAWTYKTLEPALGKVAESRWFFTLAGIAFLIGWLVIFLPPYWYSSLVTVARWESFLAYRARLQPLAAWLGFTAGYSFFYLRVWRQYKQRGSSAANGRASGKLSGAVGIALVLLLCFWLVVSITGLGISPDAYFWNEAGVPLLGLQVIASVFCVMLASRFLLRRNQLIKRKWVDWSLILAIWLGTFLLWQLTPLPRNYHAPGPYPPNDIQYPYSDAELYDFSAQYLLLGQGISNGDYQDKPAYVFLLAIFHLIADFDFELVISLQVALLALIPAGMYFLGKSLHSRQAGFLAALLAAFQQRNAIAAANDIQTASSKLLLTEYPAALVLLFFCFCMVRWLQEPETRLKYLLIGGGLLGFAGLIRPNAFILAPLMIVIILLRCGRRLKRAAVASGWFALLLFLTVLPWNLVIPRGFDTPYLIAKARSLISTRYRLEGLETPQPFSPSEQSTGSNQANQVPASPAGSGVSNPEVPQGGSPPQFIWKHYFHNEIMSFLSLPHSIELHDLKNTLQNPYWKNISTWKGELPSGSLLLILLNIGLLSAGIGTAWQRWRLAGLVPLFIHIGYHIANAIVRNSGARYLVPVDWVLLVYYALGIILALDWLAGLVEFQPMVGHAALAQEPSSKTTDRISTLGWKRAALIAVLFLLLGAILPLSKYVFPKQLVKQTPQEILASLNRTAWKDDRIAGWLAELGENQEYKNPDIMLVIGRGYYPRYYRDDLSESAGDLAAANLPAGDRSRLTLRVLSWERHLVADLPMPNVPSRLPDGTEVAVIGCRYAEGRYIDAAAILLPATGEVYWRWSDVELTCPLQMP